VNRGNFGWDYPPGVTGNEPEIAGYPECPMCGLPLDEHEEGYDQDRDVQYYICPDLLPEEATDD
jgi:hypothetical protein